MKPISIKFPMTKLRTGSRTGPRFVLRPDKTGLHGAAACAAGMVTLAMSRRDSLPARYEDAVAYRRRQRLQMRLAALWARSFAGQIAADDPRLDATQAEVNASLRAAYPPFFGVENGLAQLSAA